MVQFYFINWYFLYNVSSAVVHVLLLFLRSTVTKAGEITYQTYCINLLGKWHTMYHIDIFFSAINWKFKLKKKIAFFEWTDLELFLNQLSSCHIYSIWMFAYRCKPLRNVISIALPFLSGYRVSRHEWERNDFILRLTQSQFCNS